MRNFAVKISAVMLVIWYSLSVIGFDVHTCSGSGRTFIATVLSGTACEDIHPEHAKTPCNCCHDSGCKGHSEDDDTIRTRPCCTDDWHAISLTGVRGTDDQRTNLSFVYMCQPFCSAFTKDSHSDLSLTSFRAFYGLGQKDYISPDFQKVYSIWRI